MAYCDSTALLERFGKAELAQLTDPSATTAVPQQLIDACDEASSFIDSYIATMYTVPLSPVPTIVRRWACDIARKFLWKDRAGADNVVTLNFNATLASLRDVAKGLATLPSATGVASPGSGSSVTVVAPCEVFTERLLGAMPGGPYLGGLDSYWRELLP